MDLARLDATVNQYRQQLGGALLALDIWSSTTGLSVTGFGLTSATGPMLQRATADLRHAAATAGVQLDDYHVLTLAGGVAVVVTGERLDAAMLLPDDVDLGWVISDLVPAFSQSLQAVGD